MFKAKVVCFVIYLMCAMDTVAQRRETPQMDYTPWYFVDCVEMSNVRLDPKSIDRIEICSRRRDSVLHKYGEICIFTKAKVKLLAFDKIGRQFIKGNETIIYMLDDEVVEDTTGYRLDSAYILRSYVGIRSKQIGYLPADMKPFLFVHIEMKTDDNIYKLNHSRIRLRGAVGVLSP